jgi:hypothetical protein
MYVSELRMDVTSALLTYLNASLYPQLTWYQDSEAFS